MQAFPNTVPLDSLPIMTAECPRKDRQAMLLTESFLIASKFCYGWSNQKNREKHFVSKHINIIDPLQENNNLGRSISKGNFSRIKSAIAYGAEQMMRMLDCTDEYLISEFDHFFENTWNRHGNGSWICVSIYNLDIRNKKVGKPTCQEFEDEQDLAFLKSQGIYQKSDNQLEELKDASVVSQTRSSRTDGMLSMDIFRHESTTVDDVIRSPRASGSSMTQFPFRYNISHIEDSHYFLNHFYDILYGDFESYWKNLLYGRYCENGRLEEIFYHPPPILHSIDFRAQFYCSWRPSGSDNIVPPAVPRMPPPFTSDLHGNINQCVPYSLPIFSGGIGTFMPNLLAYHERYYNTNISERRGNLNFNSRGRFSRPGQFHRQTNNSNSNSRERFSSHSRNHYRWKNEQPGSSSSVNEQENSDNSPDQPCS